MNYGRILHRRIAKLEAVTNVISTNDKWKSIQDRALQSMSYRDLEILEEIAMQEKTGREVDASPEWIATRERYDAACMTAMGDGTVRFTIAEMDQLLVAA